MTARRALIALCLTALALAGLATPANAAEPVKIAGWGHGAGKVNGPGGVAVDQSTGDLYVADRNNFRVERFDSEGRFLLAWGWGVADGKSQELQVCGPHAEPETKRCFEAAREGLEVASGPGAVAPEALAVEQSTGDVYVVETGSQGRPGRVQKFTPSGALISLLGPDVTFSGPGDTGADETQALTVKATAGTFTLSLTAPAPFGAAATKQTTAPIPYNATHEALQAALEALPNVEAGPYAHNYVAPLKAGASGLTGTAATAISVPGGGPEACEPSRGDLCKQTAGSGAIPGELSIPFSLAFDSAGKFWVNDGPSDAANRLVRFDTDGAFLEEVPLPAGTRSGALAIDPTTDDFYLLGPQGHNELQKVNAIIQSTKGEYTLGFEGKTTAAIPGDAPANPSGCPSGEPGCLNIQEALEALPTIGKGNVSVARVFEYGGAETTNAPAEVTFIGELGGRDVPQLSASGGSPAVTVTTGRQGSPGSIEKLDPSGTLIETSYDEPGDLPAALATDSAGDLYVADGAEGSTYRLLEFDPSGDPLSAFGSGQVLGQPSGNALSFDESSGTLYSASRMNADDNYTPAQKAQVAVQRFSLPAPGPLPEGERAEAIEPSTATLAAKLNPEGHKTTYFFEWGATEGYGHSTATETLPGDGFDSEEVEARLEGLVPDTEYHFRLVATDEECTVRGEDVAFRTRTAVGVEAQWVSELAAHDATLNARLDPLGVEAQWWLEYGTSPCAGGGCVKVPEGTLPAGFGALPLAVASRGLEGSTTYHYRFAAEDTRPSCEGGQCTTYGPDQTFTTQPAGLGFTLPDNRAWEMVSPPEKHGGRITSPNGLQGGEAQAAADGEALAYLSFGSLEANPQGSRVIEEASQLSRRGPGGSWSTVDLTPPHTEINPLPVGEGLEYKLFSTNLESALLQPRDATSLSPQSTERTPYVRGNAVPPTYTPLLPASGMLPGTEFGNLGPEPSKQLLVNGNVSVAGASPDLRHVVLESVVPLLAGVCHEVTPGTGRWDDSVCREEDSKHEGGWEGPSSALYEWSGGALQVVGVKPGGEAVQGVLGSGAGSTVEAVSGDGSRVFWSTTSEFKPTGLYLRDTLHEETLRLDDFERFGGFGTGKVEPLFQGANPQGTVAFFTDTQNLTPDANEEGADLYRWRAQGIDGCAQPGGCLTDLSAEVLNFGESAEVLGLLPGIAADGSAAYLIARGVLAANTVGHGAGPEEARAGQPNLYAWSEAGGMRFVAKLSGGDSTDWGSQAGNSAAAWSLTAQVSPSGRYLAFMSALPLTGYDNRDASGGEAAQEVFRYDSQTEALACVSCNPSGARPSALVSEGQLSLLALDPQFLWKGVPVAAVVPEATHLSNGGPSLYRPRYTHDDGRVFFNAADSLVAADSNGTGDVYEYEPSGTGTCTPSAGDAGTAVVAGGCVSLISSGHATGLAAFLDASESGNDAFFYTPARLSVTDVDGETDVYDARANGEAARLQPPAECQGEACQPPATAPQTQTPASSTFRGPGNLKAPKGRRCPRGRRKVKRHGKARCVKKHRKRHARHHRRKHRSHRNGRAR